MVRCRYDADATGSTVVIAPGLDGIVAAHRAAQQATVAPSPVMMANLPDLCNPSLTPTGGGPLAAVVGRPRALVRYQTPLRGLYLTGAGTFPGAGVWGASGRNAAAVVLAARRKRSLA